MNNSMLKKLLALLIALSMALSFAACAREEEELIVDVGEPTEHTARLPTEAPTPTPELTPEPTATPEPTPEPPYVPADVDEAVRVYESYKLAYDPIDRAKVEPNYPITQPRYSMGEDGVYRSSSATGDNEAVIMLTGDLMCQTRQQEAGKTATGYSFTESFDYVRSIFNTADFVVGNLEATLSESSPYMAESIEVEGRPHLNAPASFLEAVRYAGFDMVVMSNNHNCDSGVRGIYDTLDRVDEYRLMHTGLFRNTQEPRYNVIDVDGIKIAVLSYSVYFNHKEAHLTVDGRDALLNVYTKEKVTYDAAAARAAGAEFVFVYIHWGTEYMNEPDDSQLFYAKQIADAGADFIVGSHPHALQPYDTIKSSDGRTVPVIYSMGNFVSHQTKVCTKDTIILRVVLKRDETGAIAISEQGYIPCRVIKTFLDKDYVVVPVVKPYNNGMTSRFFAPAYLRITEIIGKKIKVLGTL